MVNDKQVEYKLPTVLILTYLKQNFPIKTAANPLRNSSTTNNTTRRSLLKLVDERAIAD